MLGRKERDQPELFVAGSLRDLLPEDHVLVRVDRVLDLSWLRAEVANLYCPDNGRPGIDPEVAVRLMLAGFLHGTVNDRRLMREAQVNLAIRWFIGYGLHEALPDHSSLTRTRQRWGEAVFRTVFTRVVRQCQTAGLVSAETVHVDASLIRANVSMDALIARHLDAVDEANEANEANEAERKTRTTGKHKKLCGTDPDATMATSSKAPLRPAYKQHTAVDDHAGVVVDVEIVTGEEHDTGRFAERVDAMTVTLRARPGQITADAAYGTGHVYAALEEREVGYVIPNREPVRRKDTRGFPIERFKYDAHKDVVRCPNRKILTPRNATKSGRWYRADRQDCRACPLRARCIAGNAPSRRVHITNHFPAILRARRKRRHWGDDERAIYIRHRWRVEGAHGTAKTLHGLNRAIRRGLANMKIQSLLTAIAMNLKKLAGAALAVLLAIARPAIVYTFRQSD
jgi:transposase